MFIWNAGFLHSVNLTQTKRRYGTIEKKNKIYLRNLSIHRRTGNRGQTCLPVGLEVIDNSPLPARHQNKYGSQKPRPLSIADFRLLRTHVVLVQASISSLHHRIGSFLPSEIKRKLKVITQLKCFRSRMTFHKKAKLDASGFIRAEENDKRTYIKKFVENFTFL